MASCGTSFLVVVRLLILLILHLPLEALSLSPTTISIEWRTWVRAAFSLPPSSSGINSRQICTVDSTTLLSTSLHSQQAKTDAVLRNDRKSAHFRDFQGGVLLEYSGNDVQPSYLQRVTAKVDVETTPSSCCAVTSSVPDIPRCAASISAQAWDPLPEKRN
jgi:hypothetical protein